MINKIKICVAVDNQGGFAKNNSIPWYIPEDFKHFISTTKGSWCVTGKNSYLEMVEMKKRNLGDKYDPDSPILKDRITFVVSSTLSEDGLNDAVIVRPNDIDRLFNILQSKTEDRDLFILGGKQLYEELLDKVDEVIITLIPDNFDCDRHFPMQRLGEDFKQSDERWLPTNAYGEESVLVRTYTR